MATKGGSDENRTAVPCFDNDAHRPHLDPVHHRPHRRAGLTTAVGYPENPKPHSPWAKRMMAAHEIAVENLVVFAGLVLAAHALGISNSATATACVVYFWARVVHLAAYTFAVPWVRT